MRRVFAPLTALVRERIYGPEPVGLAGATILALQDAAELGGRMGTVHFGMKGDPSVSFTGLVQSPQQFVGPAQMGSSPGVTVENVPALPSDQAPPAMPSWYNDWTDMSQVAGNA